ncbi:MAG: hypothetical protein AMXMBFR64_19630 [Myxococcales bacterium]
MKKLLVVLILAALVAGGWWAWDRWFRGGSPSDAYRRMVNAARLGDEDTFLEGFTEKSRPLVKALIALSRDYEVVREDPYERIVLSDVVGETVEGDRATIVTEQGRKTREIRMTKVDGRWQIDAFDLDEDWSRPGAP